MGAEGSDFAPSLIPSGTLSPPSPAVQLTSVTVWSARHPTLKLPSAASPTQSGLRAPPPLPLPLRLCSGPSIPPFSCYNSFLASLSPPSPVYFPPLHPYCPSSRYIHVQKSPTAPHPSKMKANLLDTAFKALHTHHQTAFPSTNPPLGWKESRSVLPKHTSHSVFSIL